MIEIRSLFAIQFQHIRYIQAAALQPVGKGLLAIFVIVDADNIVALPQLDHHSTTKAFNVKHIINGVIGRRRRFIAHIDPGQASMCTRNMQFVVRIAGLKDQGLETGVFDTNGHTQADDFVLGQTVSAIGGSIAVIADAQDIIAFGYTAGLGPTVDCQQPEQHIIHGELTVGCRGNRLADCYRVDACTRFDKGWSVHGPKIYLISPPQRPQRGLVSQTGRDDRGNVIAIAQVDLDIFNRDIGDPGGRQGKSVDGYTTLKLRQIDQTDGPVQRTAVITAINQQRVAATVDRCAARAEDIERVDVNQGVDLGKRTVVADCNGVVTQTGPDIQRDISALNRDHIAAASSVEFNPIRTNMGDGCNGCAGYNELIIIDDDHITIVRALKAYGRRT